MKRIALLLCLLACLPSLAFAGGVNLSWSECGEMGAMNRTFACNSNSGGPEVLVGSFVPPAGIDSLVGISIVLDLGEEAGATSSWWSYVNPGACRQTALSANADFTSLPFPVCMDVWNGQAVPGGLVYTLNQYGIACRSRLTASFAIPRELAAALDETVEYYAFRVMISHANTVGATACSGCLTPLVIYLTEIELHQPSASSRIRLTYPALRNFASWQGGSGLNNCIRTPVRSSTWGAIKTLYH